MYREIAFSATHTDQIAYYVYFHIQTSRSNMTSQAPDSDEFPPTLLTEFLCFAIYSANLAYGRAYRPLLNELGITYTQWIAIIALWDEDNQTVSALGEKLFMESNTLTPMLKKLEALGFLTRRRATADERQVIVSLTEQGRALRTTGGRTDLATPAGLTQEEFSALRKAVVKLRNNLISSVPSKEIVELPDKPSDEV